MNESMYFLLNMGIGKCNVSELRGAYDTEGLVVVRQSIAFFVLVNVCNLSTWWFQIYFLFSSLLGEDSHFD